MMPQQKATENSYMLEKGPCPVIEALATMDMVRQRRAITNIMVDERLVPFVLRLVVSPLVAAARCLPARQPSRDTRPQRFMTAESTRLIKAANSEKLSM
jgi:hypothetical protein